MKRWLLVPALALVAASCQDMNESATGPQESSSIPTFSHVGDPQSCLDLADHAPADGSAAPQQSPCDGRLPAGFTGTAGFYFLSPTTGSPTITETFQSGLASVLAVTVENTFCPIAGEPDGCSDATLPAVTEGTDSYGTSWKTRKKNDVLAESVWRVRVWAVAGADSILLGYRDIEWSNDPSQDQPADDPIKVVQLGSNENINFFLSEDVDTCPTTGALSLTCLITDQGQTLTVTGPMPGQEARLNVGPGNGINVFTLEWTGTCDESLGTDTPPLSCVVTAESPTLAQDAILEGSSIEICDPYPSVVIDGAAKVYVAKRDADALTALPWLSVTDCPVVPSSLVDASGLPGMLKTGLHRIASVFTAKPLVATSLVAGTSGGGRLRDLSDFQLTSLPEMAFEGSGGSVQPDEPVTATVRVRSRTDAAVEIPNTTVWFYPDTDGVLTCAAGADCVTDGAIAPGALGVVTGDDGLAVVDWVPGGSGDRTLTAVSCGTAVDGSDTPTDNPTGFILGDPTPDGTTSGCDRNPADPDDGTQGYANGTIANDRDPFEPYAEATDVNGDGFTEYEVALNDLPTTYTVSICAAPDIDGIKDDSWNDCAAGELEFPVNLPGGGKNSGAMATLRWLNTSDDLVLSVEVPRDSDESSTSLWFEFDSGFGSDLAASENDDLIGVQRKSGISVPSDRYLDATCAGSSGSSVCNAIDASQDVTAGVQFNGGTSGGFIFYEISHPLTGDSPQDFDLESGESVGLFLRLAVGNGAQGKTIWPGFRDYRVIQIQ